MSRSHPERFADYRAVSQALTLLADRELAEIVEGAPAMVLDVGGTPVFAKRVALTDLERRRDHEMSTANLFELPTFYQYGIGSAGFGVWREVASHALTNAWVLGNECESFPLLYHWRVLDAPAQPRMQDELDRMVAYWDGLPAVRARLEAIASARANVVLFLEYVPHTLHDWLTAQVALGDAAVAAACSMVEPALSRVVAFMRANDFVHFDAHFRNILTDGQRVVFADLGLASSRRFELSEIERSFLDRHASYDGCRTVTQLVNWLDSIGGAARSAAAAAIIERYAPIAAVMNAFLERLCDGSKSTPYPYDEVATLWSRCEGAGWLSGES